MHKITSKFMEDALLSAKKGDFIFKDYELPPPDQRRDRWSEHPSG
jgi:hypothetical protein